MFIFIGKQKWFRKVFKLKEKYGSFFQIIMWRFEGEIYQCYFKNKDECEIINFGWRLGKLYMSYIFKFYIFKLNYFVVIMYFSENIWEFLG